MQNDKQTDETTKKEELEKRREREATMSDEELQCLQEQAKTLKAEVDWFFFDFLQFSFREVIIPVIHFISQAKYLFIRVNYLIRISS